MRTYGAAQKIIANLLRFAFHMLYHQFAWMYDLVAWLVSFGRWQSWTRASLDQLDLPEGGRVLELGFGPGHLLLEMSRRGIRCLGIDESRQMCRIASRRLLKTGSVIIRGDAKHLPLAAGAFDAVIATFPSEYIFAQQVLENSRRVLRKGGNMIILMGVEPGGFTLFDRLLRLLYRISNQEFESRFGPATYVDRIRTVGLDVRTAGIEVGKDKLWMIFGHKV